MDRMPFRDAPSYSPMTTHSRGFLAVEQNGSADHTLKRPFNFLRFPIAEPNRFIGFVLCPVGGHPSFASNMFDFCKKNSWIPFIMFLSCLLVPPQVTAGSVFEPRLNVSSPNQEKVSTASCVAVSHAPPKWRAKQAFA